MQTSEEADLAEFLAISLRYDTEISISASPQIGHEIGRVSHWVTCVMSLIFLGGGHLRGVRWRSSRR